MCVTVQVYDQLTRYCVLEHPLLLTMVDIHDVPPHPSHGHLITLVEHNLFQQQVAIYSLQLPDREEKVCLSQGRRFASSGYKCRPFGIYSLTGFGPMSLTGFGPMSLISLG